MDEVPRPLQIYSKVPKEEQQPIGTRHVTDPEVMRRLEPLMGLIARGDIPLDDTAAKAVATYANGFHKRAR
jgi:hypothetical protein